VTGKNLDVTLHFEKTPKAGYHRILIATRKVGAPHSRIEQRITRIETFTRLIKESD
jgi:hypothetical protein